MSRSKGRRREGEERKGKEKKEERDEGGGKRGKKEERKGRARRIAKKHDLSHGQGHRNSFPYLRAAGYSVITWSKYPAGESMCVCACLCVRICGHVSMCVGVLCMINKHKSLHARHFQNSSKESK